MATRCCSIPVLFALVASVAGAQIPARPLGIFGGMPIAELLAKGDRPHPKQRGVFLFSKTPFAGLERMAVLATPKTGACKVNAFTEVFDSNNAGTQVRERFEALVSRFAEKYGPPSSNYDYVRRGALWKEDNEFMMALVKEERTLASYWIRKEIERPMALSDGIASISIEAKAISSSRASIMVSYDFENVKECIAILRGEENEAL